MHESVRQHFVVFLFFCISLQAQEYAAVDTKVKSYQSITSVEKLAAKIAADFDSDHDRVRASFRWLTDNIRYDLRAYYTPTTTKISFSYRNEAEKQQRIQAHKNALVATVFSSRKSVCEGYAQAFKKICDLLGITAVVIKGHSRNTGATIGSIPEASNHAWNAVYLDSEWQLLDATWAAGYEFNGQWKKQFTPYYYFPTPAALLRTHFPEDVKWQLTDAPITKRAFANQPLMGQGFFDSTLVLIHPKKGNISAKKTSFIIENLTKKEVIAYLFQGQKYGTRAKVRYAENRSNFTIDLRDKKNSQLTIFINGSVALIYAID